VAAVLVLAGALCGCANVDYDTSQAWFAKPLDLTGRNAGGYTFSELAETKQHQRPITANDLVNGNGSCPLPAAPAQPAVASGGNQPTPAAPPAAPSPLGGGIALGMSECDVVNRAGAPTAVQIGKAPNGTRTAVISFNSGPRAGVYHFEGGSLMEMDSVPQAAAPPPAVAKKKATKSAKKSDQS
jgi:hypothetical protein